MRSRCRFNVLVSTSVGEEGLDIGEVDLIVCFDAPKSNIRLVQRCPRPSPSDRKGGINRRRDARCGRTGRKREGRIVVLVTEGKEDRVCLVVRIVLEVDPSPCCRTTSRPSGARSA